MSWLIFISTVIGIISTCLYINNIIVDISNAVMSMYSMNQSDAENTAKGFARYRIILSIIMGISWGIVICL